MSDDRNISEAAERPVAEIGGGLRFAYADPPYPGQTRRHYGDHPDFAGEVDHAELVARLVDGYDGWALSTSAAALQDVLALCPPRVRIGIWHRTNSGNPVPQARWWWMWEPVIVSTPRASRADNPDVVRDLLATHTLSGFLGNTITGEKPPAFCHWVFRLLGALPGDTLDDLYPGSGAVGREWEAFEAQIPLLTTSTRAALPLPESYLEAGG